MQSFGTAVPWMNENGKELGVNPAFCQPGQVQMPRPALPADVRSSKHSQHGVSVRINDQGLAVKIDWIPVDGILTKTGTQEGERE